MYVFVDRYGCFNSEKFMSQGEYSPILHKEHKIQNSCENITNNPDNFHYAGDSGLFFKTCVCNFHNPSFSILLDLENKYNENGIIPQGLGVQRISNKLHKTFGIIRAYKIDWEKAEMEKMRQKHKVKSR